MRSPGWWTAGWGLPAAFGVKLAHPDSQVVSVVGDGAFLFAGPQPLWSYARYKAPVTLIVCNNRSYNNERNRIWNIGGRQFQTGRDMTCYLGDPDIDYAKLASGFGVEGEIVAEPAQLPRHRVDVLVHLVRLRPGKRRDEANPKLHRVRIESGPVSRPARVATPSPASWSSCAGCP